MEVPNGSRGWRQLYLASFHRCVSYFTHRRIQPRFLALHDLTAAVPETRPGDARTTFPGRSIEFGTDDIDKKVGPLPRRAARKAPGQTPSGRLDALDQKVIESDAVFG
jgi:hypothetical protein